MSDTKREFEVALSFAGEDRVHADELARLLQAEGVSVFYDEFFRSTLWGRDLFQHLQVVYRDKAEYCIVFVSKDYVSKHWTKHEIKQAQTRSFSQDREYILPVRIDDSELPGLNPTVGYLDIKQVTMNDICSLLLEKLGRQTRERKKANASTGMDNLSSTTAREWPRFIHLALKKRSIYLL